MSNNTVKIRITWKASMTTENSKSSIKVKQKIQFLNQTLQLKSQVIQNIVK